MTIRPVNWVNDMEKEIDRAETIRRIETETTKSCSEIGTSGGVTKLGYVDVPTSGEARYEHTCAGSSPAAPAKQEEYIELLSIRRWSADQQ